MTRAQDTRLRSLSDSELMLPHSGDDIRWCHVVDAANHDLGTIDELIVDEDERKVRFLRVRFGGILGFGASELLIPTEAVESVTERVVHVDRWRGDGTVYDPELVDPSHYAQLSDYFGY